MRPTRAVLSRFAGLVALCLSLPLLLASEAGAQGTVKKGDRNRLTAEEVAQSGNFSSAFEVIQAVRPLWLNPPLGRNAMATMDGPRGNTITTSDSRGGSATEIVVYVDGIRQPSLDELKTVRSPTIVEMRYLDQNRAVQMHGPGHEMGVIEVVTTNKKK